MPALAHPDSLIQEHQRLRGDPVDSACSSTSVASFFGSLWPNRRKLAPLSKSTSVLSDQDPNEATCKKPSGSVHFFESENDANSWSMRFPRRVFSARLRSNLSSEQCCRETQEVRSGVVSTEEHDLHMKISFAEAFSSVLERSTAGHTNKKAIGEGTGQSNVHSLKHGLDNESLGLNPIMESLKEVAIYRRGADNAVNLCPTDTAANLRGLVDDEENGRGCVDHMLAKRSARFKAGKPIGFCSLKKLRLSTLSELVKVASFLQSGSSEERLAAADELIRLCKDDPIARVTLGVQLKVIPSLVSMLESPHPKHQCTALLALLNLAAGNDVNKAAIMKERALGRLIKLLQSRNAEVQATVVTFFLSLSALDANKAAIGDSGSIPLLVNLSLKQHTKKDAIRALYNLSLHDGNAKVMVESGCIPHVLHLVSDADIADKALATLSNLAGSEAGCHALGEQQDLAYTTLIDVLRRAEMPKLQERAVYVLMMIAHHSPAQREAMAAAGVIPALLELSLLGSVLAQKRATRTLDSFRRAKAFSGPQQCQCLQAEVPGVDGARLSSEQKIVDGLVKQSLHRTMQRIVRRATSDMVLVKDPAPSTSVPTSRSFRQPLDRRSSSCSLPF